LVGFGVHPAVIDRLYPRGEQGVQLHQVVEFTARADLDEELIPHRAEHPFDFPSAGGLPRLGMHQPDPQRRARAEQLFVHEGRSVVDIDRGGDAAGGDAGAQRGLEPHRVLAACPPVTGEQPAVVIEEREQDRLTSVDGGAVQRVAGPPLIRGVGFEPAERLRWLPVRSGVQLQPHEVPLQGPLVRRPPRVRPQNGRHLRRGPAGNLTFQRGGQVENLGRGPRRDPPLIGHQRIEPGPTPVPDPPIDRGPRDADWITERAGMLPGRQIADQRAPLLRGQLPVRGLADHRIPEQPDRPSPFGPDLIFPVMAVGHCYLLALVMDTHEMRGSPINRSCPRASWC
jgi:hypothetical protein